MIVVPARFAAWRSQLGGAAGRRWISELPGLVEQLCAEWSLTVEDPAPRHGGLGLVVMVRRAGVPLALKVSWQETSTHDQEVALAAWDGRGAVQLVEAAPDRGALLLERLDPGRTLHDLELWTAAELAGRLIRRLSVPAPPGLRTLSTVAAEMALHLARRQQALGDPVPRAWLDAARGLAQELGERPVGVLVHADLHYGNVLAGRREPWLAIDPRAIDGSPEFSVPELLWTRADDLVDGAAVRRLVRVLADSGELDHEIARGWAVARCVDYWLWGLESGLTEDPVRCEKVLTALLS